MIEAQGRAAVTSAAIEKSALELALTHGYAHVTVDMICEAAGVSQRTFFNHFPAKDDAILGRDLPRIDERAARRFIVSSGPVLLDALELVDLPAKEGEVPRIDERMRVIAQSPTLMARQMERVTALEAELRDIITVRLEHERPGGNAAELHDDATMVTHLLSGMVRFLGTGAGGDSTLDEAVVRARAAVGRLVGATPSEGGDDSLEAVSTPGSHLS